MILSVMSCQRKNITIYEEKYKTYENNTCNKVFQIFKPSIFIYVYIL